MDLGIPPLSLTPTPPPPRPHCRELAFVSSPQLTSSGCCSRARLQAPRRISVSETALRRIACQPSQPPPFPIRHPTPAPTSPHSTPPSRVTTGCAHCGSEPPLLSYLRSRPLPSTHFIGKATRRGAERTSARARKALLWLTGVETRASCETHVTTIDQKKNSNHILMARKMHRE